MHEATGTFVNILTTSIESFLTMFLTGIFNFWKFGFCEIDSQGNITSLNLLGSIVIILLCISLIGSFLIWFIELATPWHHPENSVEMNEDLENNENAVLNENDTRYVIGDYNYSRLEIAKARDRLEEQKRQANLMRHLKYDDRVIKHKRIMRDSKRKNDLEKAKKARYEKYKDVANLNIWE